MYSITEIRQLIRNKETSKFYDDNDWRILSATVRKEYHNECQLCSKKGKVRRAVITHHVRHLKDYPELAYSRTYIDDSGKEQIQLLPVCFACHEECHPERRWGKRENKYTNDERW